MNTKKIRSPKELIPSEHDEQSKLIQWAKAQLNIYPALANLYKVTNEGKKSWGHVKYAKAEGLEAGVPDLVLAVQNNQYGSLYIEMKKQGRQNERNGGLTDSQKLWRDKLITYGMLSVICYSFDEAREAIINYLANRNNRICALMNRDLNSTGENYAKNQ